MAWPPSLNTSSRAEARFSACRLPRSICAAPPPQPAFTAMYCSPSDDESDRARDRCALHGHLPQLLAVRGAEDREESAAWCPRSRDRRRWSARRRCHGAAAALSSRLLRHRVPGHEPAFSRGSPSFCSSMRFFSASPVYPPQPPFERNFFGSRLAGARTRTRFVGREVGELGLRAVGHQLQLSNTCQVT